MEPFQQALKIYTDATSSQPNNLQYVLSSLAGSLCLPLDLIEISCCHFKSLQFSQTHEVTPPPALCFILSLSLSLFLCLSLSQCVGPEPSGQIMLHHVRVLAGPSLLDEVGLKADFIAAPKFARQALLARREANQGGVLFHPFLFSATCSRPSARPSSAASLTRWRSRRWSPPCSSQVTKKQRSHHRCIVHKTLTKIPKLYKVSIYSWCCDG